MRDFAHGQCRTAAGVAIKLRQNDPCDRQSSVKAARYTNGLLPGRRIGNKQDFLRPQEFFERFKLIHERFVDFLTPRRIEDADGGASSCAPRTQGYIKQAVA